MKIVFLTTHAIERTPLNRVTDISQIQNKPKPMKPTSYIALRIASLLALAGTALAQVPTMISYQGRVQVSGTNFSGTGQFKFALVSPGTNINRRATAVATVTGVFVTGINVTDGGSGYVNPPAVTITDTSGSGASATAQISGGVVTSITVILTGGGYSSSPTVTIAPPPPSVANDTLWTNDGTSAAGGEPSTAVSVAVQQGLFTVFLGDTTLANMEPVPASVFTQQDVRLRIWFNNGVSGFAQLSPDQNLGSVGFAMTAAQLASTTDGQPLVFKAGGSETMRINSVGNVGIGATNVQQLLHLNVTAGHGEGMRIDSAIAGHSPAIYLNHTGTGGRNFRIASFGDNVNPGSFRIRDDTVGSDRLVIEANGRVEVNGGINIFDGFFKSHNAGIATEVNARLVNFGINDGPVNRFGGTYTAASQGGFLRVEARPGVPLFGFHGRPAGTNADASQLGYITSSGTVRFEIGANQKFSLGSSGTFEIDSSGATAGRFLVNDSGNVGIGNNNPGEKLHVIGNILASGTITPNSDRNAKTGIAPVDSTAILERVARLPIHQWRFKTEAGNVKHVGPMAQDFRETFGLGAHETAIATVDADGVALAAIQGLNQKVDSENARLRDELKQRAAENSELRQRLEKLEQLLDDKLKGTATLKAVSATVSESLVRH